ncbi:DUF2252 family protein [Neptuniibacter caesariensis]|uniref:DUF2252 domain-containing protein n=1 Tax=Neptuniibacter caesariensis TaxID=207954 RepID=A0A7U8GTT0_NEPCE|nr:DUF2252 family protein [Neptuniibacter caesariensis]EAR62455.1 hypothetical protein MED92_15498 [Oceanospirillum sp. MED92] [Neptuniibacter caesariensis]
MNQRQKRLSKVISRVDGALPGSGLGKHKKMAISPFVMLRGASSVFYDDLASGVITLPHSLKSIPTTAIIGDCHISNFGLFSEEGSHGDRTIFAPNDFDDACIGRAEWDLLRFAVSMILCADHCKGIKSGQYFAAEPVEKVCVGSKQVKAAISTFFQSYAESCHDLAEDKLSYRYVLESFEPNHILYKRSLKAQARTCDGTEYLHKSSLAKAIDLQRKPLRFRDLPEKFSRLTQEQFQEIKEQFAPYVDDQIIDIAMRLGAGTGSVNMERYYLLVGPNENPDLHEFPLFHIVEIKKQRDAAPLFNFDNLSPVNLLNPAHLTVTCQRRMQRNPDLVLDAVAWKGAHWLVRSRHHAKVGIDPEHIATGKKAIKGGFVEYAQACAKALALAHARGDRRSNYFEAAAGRLISQESEALVEAAYDYANQVIEDWKWLESVEN